jgi:hypothetical protein
MRDSTLRELFVAVAAVVLPGNDRQPSAVDVDIGGPPLDRLLSSRPDLESRLTSILKNFVTEEFSTPEEFVESLNSPDLRILVTALCGAYFLIDKVQQTVDYAGQQALTLDRGGFGGEELALKQMGLPKRYRDPME